MSVALQFVLEPSFTSDVIAWFSQGHLSHVDALMPDGSLLGARSDWKGGKPPGVQIRPPNYAKFKSRVIMELPATPVQETLFYNFLQAQVGKPYDMQAIWAFALDRDWREPDSWICSELDGAALEHATIFRKLYLGTNKITPVALALACSASNASVIIY